MTTPDMTLDPPVRSVAVVGGGVVGWSAAAALKRRLPSLDVTIVPVPPPADALADRIASTLPSILGFHDDLAIRDEDAVVRTGSGYRLGTLFERWAEGAANYVHAYGEHGRPFGTSSFHHHWVRAARTGSAAPFDSHSPAAMLARAGRFAPTPTDAASPFAGLEYGLQLDLERYRAMLAAFASHLVVRVREGEVAGVTLDVDGAIGSVELVGAEPVRADLYVDATGPAAMLRGAMDRKWEDWSRWLPSDRVLEAQAPAAADPPALDRAIAMPAGWRWVVHAPGAVRHGLVYASAHLSDEAAARALKGASGVRPSSAPVLLRQGTRPEPWKRNCVAIGDAATAIEPLEWTNLHLAHSAIDRIVAMMPGRGFAPVELADYNRQTAAEVARVRDLVILHYAAARRPEPFWQQVAAAEPPASLAHTLSLFRERGRLPFHEEETFARDSWLAVLLGQGVLPRRDDPLVDAVLPEQADQAMAAWRARIAAALPSLTTPAAFPGAQQRQIAR